MNFLDPNDKSFFYGTVTGRFSSDHGVSLKEAKKVVHQFHQAYPQLQKYMVDYGDMEMRVFSIIVKYDLIPRRVFLRKLKRLKRAR